MTAAHTHISQLKHSRGSFLLAVRFCRTDIVPHEEGFFLALFRSFGWPHQSSFEAFEVALQSAKQSGEIRVPKSVKPLLQPSELRILVTCCWGPRPKPFGELQPCVTSVQRGPSMLCAGVLFVLALCSRTWGFQDVADALALASRNCPLGVV